MGSLTVYCQISLGSILSVLSFQCVKMEVRDLDVGDLLGLLESPQEEVAQEVRLLLKETFSTVRESWLITGLLEYFYVSNR